MKKVIKSPYFILGCYSLIVAVISHYFINVGDLQHDYGYHLARLVGLAQSIKNGDYLPNLNFVFGNNIGYASPMFYGNWQFYFPSIIYLLTRSASIAYTSFAFELLLFLTWSSFFSVKGMINNERKGLLFSMTVAVTFPWFGYGMTMAAMFVPLIIYSIYKVLFQEKLNPVLLGVSVALLLQTHLLSTLILGIYGLVFLLLNIKQCSLLKMISFLKSGVIAVLLSIGYLIQYVEQVKSQKFFFNWTLRNYPFSSEALVVPESFTSLLVNYEKPIILILMIILFSRYRKLSEFSRQLLIVSSIMFIAQSDIFPWKGLLHFTFLATLQDTRRIVFFTPILIMLACTLELSRKNLYQLLICQLAFYMFSSVLNYLPRHSVIQNISNYNTLSREAFTFSSSGFDTSGDEYFTSSVNNSDVRDGTINNFEYDTSKVKIVNIKKGYNNLEFDILSKDGSTIDSPITVVLPRIWYKGYQVTYSEGADGGIPKLAYGTLTKNEKAIARAYNSPDKSKKTLYDGRITLSIRKLGHVKVYYKKTFLQIVGYTLETVSFIVLGLYIFVKSLKMSREV